MPDKTEHAVVTVMGQDRVGIVAGVSATLAACNVNIIDISQTLLQDIFAMLLTVDLAGADRDLPALQELLDEAGLKIGVKIVIQHEDIFKYMHRI